MALRFRSGIARQYSYGCSYDAGQSQARAQYRYESESDIGSVHPWSHYQEYRVGHDADHAETADQGAPVVPG